jgi:predicted Zn-dependent protease
MKFTRLAHACLSALLAMSSIAADLPDLGDSAVGDLPPHEERRIADLVARELRQSGEAEDDPEIVDYLNRLGYQLASNSNDSTINFRFYPISSPEINAWAIPGGIIGVNLGLVVLTQHESELAAVMAHEIGHVTQHHYARMIQSQKGQGFLTLASLAVAILAARNSSNPETAAGAVEATQGYQIQRQINFTREYEREADQTGMQTLQKAGFDPHAMPVFFDRMQHFYRNMENGALSFLQTHPVTTERIAYSQSRIADLPYKQWTDSLDYLFVREKARCLQLGVNGALDYYAGTTQQKKYSSEVAQQYGYAYALFRAKRYDEAWATVSEARKQFGDVQPMLESLAGNIRLEEHRYPEAEAIFNAAAARFPSAPALYYGQIDVKLRAGQLQEASHTTEDELSRHKSDPGLYLRLAQAYSGLNEQTQSHRAMADYYALIGETTSAIRQVQIALKSGGDFYQMSALEARLKELRDQLPVDKHGKPIKEDPDDRR